MSRFLSTLARNITKVVVLKPQNPLARAWKTYVTFLDSHPLRAQAANTCVLFGAGDVIAQTILERRWGAKYDKMRTLRFLGVGFFVFGPTMHVWYSLTLTRIVSGSGIVAAVKMMLLDQIFFLPAYIASFFCIMATLRGESRRQMKEQLDKEYWPVQLTSWKLWPTVQIVNFYFVPVHHRILLMNSVSLVWNTYLGWTAEQVVEEVSL